MDLISASTTFALFAYLFYDLSSRSHRGRQRHSYEVIPSSQSADETIELTYSQNIVKNKIKTLINQIEQYMTIVIDVLSNIENYYQRYIDFEKGKSHEQILQSFLTHLGCALKEIDHLITISCELDLSDDDLRALTESQLHEKDVLLQEQIEQNNIILNVSEGMFESIRYVRTAENNYNDLLLFIEEKCNEFEIPIPFLLSQENNQKQELKKI